MAPWALLPHWPQEVALPWLWPLFHCPCWVPVGSPKAATSQDRPCGCLTLRAW